MSAFEFGRQLITTRDLDPVYNVVWRSGLHGEELHKWLLAYWCFYHVGTASWITDQPDYWAAMLQAAGSKEWPRSPERRYYRGAQAVNSVTWLRDRGVENLFRPLLCPPTQVESILNVVQTWRGFGPWISFKVADMLERLGLTKIEFSPHAGIYTSPREGALRLWRMSRVTEPGPETVPWALKIITQVLGDLYAPPRMERPIGVQEAETILCKWNSYSNSHYHLGEDVTAVQQGLLKFPSCKTAQQLLRGGKLENLW